MQDDAVDFVRVKDLEVGDLFCWQGTWFKVAHKDKKVIGYLHLSHKNKYRTNSFSHTLGVKSQQFVQVKK